MLYRLAILGACLSATAFSDARIPPVSGRDHLNDVRSIDAASTSFAGAGQPICVFETCFTIPDSVATNTAHARGAIRETTSTPPTIVHILSQSHIASENAALSTNVRDRPCRGCRQGRAVQGTPSAILAVHVVSQISDGQVQAPTGTIASSKPTLTSTVAIATSRPMTASVSTLPTASRASQIGDGQVQAPTGGRASTTTQPASQQQFPIEGYTGFQASTAGTSTLTKAQSSTGGSLSAGVQASTAGRVSQIGDGQVQAPTGSQSATITRVPTPSGGSPITNTQAQAPTSGRASQIGDGQVQAPTAGRASQIGDGQVQAPTAGGAPTATQASTAGRASQISDGQIQAPVSTTATTFKSSATMTPLADVSNAHPPPPTMYLGAAAARLDAGIRDITILIAALLLW